MPWKVRLSPVLTSMVALAALAPALARERPTPCPEAAYRIVSGPVVADDPESDLVHVGGETVALGRTCPGGAAEPHARAGDAQEHRRPGAVGGVHRLGLQAARDAEDRPCHV
jgi:hypothetical protein